MKKFYEEPCLKIKMLSCNDIMEESWGPDDTPNPSDGELTELE